jgi:hypothetical protein
MSKKINCLLLLLAPLTVFAAPENSSVTIPVAEYMALKRQSELPSLTTIEEVVFRGNYGKELSVAISGASMGVPKAAEVLAFSPQNLALHDCTGNAAINAESNSISILPMAPRFKLTCKVSVKNWANINFTVLNALFLSAQIEGGEALIDSAAMSRKSISIARMRKGSEPVLAGEITAFGRYRMSITPDSTNFSYSIEVVNPARTKTPFEIRWPNGEIVQSVRTTTEYEEKSGGLRLQLAPGPNVISITGKFRGTSFVAPFERGQQFVLVENHPMLQVSLESPGRRIASSDAGMSPAFSSARAYLLEKGQSIVWKAKKLDVFATTGYSIPEASYSFFIPENGEGLVEAQFQINNQGTAEIPLKIPGTAAYLEVDGTPQVLSKDSEGRLLLQLSQGMHRVLLQYKTATTFTGAFSPVRIDFARPDAVISNASVSLAFTNPVSMLYAKGMNQTVTDFSQREFIAALFAFIAIFFSFRALGFSPAARLAFSFGIAFLHLLNPHWLMTTFLCLILLALVHYRNRIAATFFATLNGPRPTWQKILAFAAIAGASFMLLSFYSNLNRYNRGFATESASLQNFASVDGNSDSLAQMGMQSLAGGGRAQKMAMGKMIHSRQAEEIEVPTGNESVPAAAAAFPPSLGEGNYQGLPARISPPRTLRQIGFQQGLIDEKAQIRIGGLFLNKKYVGNMELLLCLALLGWALRRREHFIEFLRA